MKISIILILIMVGFTVLETLATAKGMKVVNKKRRRKAIITELLVIMVICINTYCVSSFKSKSIEDYNMLVMNNTITKNNDNEALSNADKIIHNRTLDKYKKRKNSFFSKDYMEYKNLDWESIDYYTE